MFKTSIRYRLIQTMFRMLRVNRMLDKKGPEFHAFLQTYAEKQKVPLNIPHKKMDDDFDIEERVMDGTTFYIVREKGKTPKKAILYFFGGGYILPPDSGDLILCGQMAKSCDAEVWFPLYPMAPEHRLIETVSRCCRIYETLLDQYDAPDIRFFGTSSGGGLALSICMYIVHERLDLPLPGKLVLQSPGIQVPPSGAQRTEMDRLKERDVMIPPGFFDRIAPVLATGDDAYLLSPLLFDLSGFPPMDIFYGTNEVMMAYVPDLKAACERHGVSLRLHIGEGMMHCWGAMDFVPEAKAVRKEYFQALQ